MIDLHVPSIEPILLALECKCLLSDDPRCLDNCETLRISTNFFHIKGDLDGNFNNSTILIFLFRIFLWCVWMDGLGREDLIFFVKSLIL